MFGFVFLVPTQVVLAKNISPQAKGIMSIATKIGIQINCKLGGAPWSVEIPLNVRLPSVLPNLNSREKHCVKLVEYITIHLIFKKLYFC